MAFQRSGFQNNAYQGNSQTQQDVMYWGLLHHRKRKKEDENVVVEQIEVKPDVVEDGLQSSMQLAMREALLAKQREDSLDSFIDAMAAETARKQSALEAAASDDEQIAVAVVLLM